MHWLCFSLRGKDVRPLIALGLVQPPGLLLLAMAMLIASIVFSLLASAVIIVGVWGVQRKSR